MDNVTDFPKQTEQDLIAEMTGPQQSGCSVIIDGRLVPHMVMRDCGDTIEFVVDGRMIFPVAREHAYQAASLAFHAMAIAAGFAHPAHMHFTQRAYAPQVMGLSGLPKS